MSALKDRLIRRIRADGPISLAAYMAEALFDPMEGFYATKDPIGAGADFITAPEISQMFGELTGVWAIEAWRGIGAPQPVRLIELGPGRGTLMSDMLRVAHLDEVWRKALDVHLVEISPALKTVQARTLGEAGAALGWLDRLDDAPEGAAIIIGNEFLDCLPVRQAVRRDGAWRERRVGLHPEDGGRLAYVLDVAPLPAEDTALIPEALRDSPDGALAEIRAGDAAIVETLARRFAHAPGYALFIDYGPVESEVGDTFQAIQAHEKVDPLAEPGRADLTARVDFAALARTACAAGLSVFGPVAQGRWLQTLGIEQRAAALTLSGKADRAAIARQLHRLTGEAEMGALFKVIAIGPANAPPPPGFTQPRHDA